MVKKNAGQVLALFGQKTLFFSRLLRNLANLIEYKNTNPE